MSRFIRKLEFIAVEICIKYSCRSIFIDYQCIKVHFKNDEYVIRESLKLDVSDRRAVRRKPAVEKIYI